MKRTVFLRGGSSLALAIALTAGAAHAQTRPDTTPTEVEEVVVTGSFIRGTPEDAALPVDVIGAEELQKRGSPSTVELLKALSVSSGVLGEAERERPRRGGFNRRSDRSIVAAGTEACANRRVDGCDSGKTNDRVKSVVVDLNLSFKILNAHGACHRNLVTLGRTIIQDEKVSLDLVLGRACQSDREFGVCRQDGARVFLIRILVRAEYYASSNGIGCDPIL